MALATRDDVVRVTASDISQDRLKQITPRINRAGVSVGLMNADTVTTAAPFDAVVCDVPCSGSGTWRRSPEVPWRFQQDDLDQLLITQKQIMQKAVPLVKAGGTLHYITCSVFTQENQGQVAGMLAEFPNLELLDEVLLTPSPDNDGFYLASFAVH